VKALRKKERQDETQFTTKIGEKTSLGPNYFVFVKFSFLVKLLIDALLYPRTLAISTFVRGIINYF
jgi:hypothetical protein